MIHALKCGLCSGDVVIDIEITNIYGKARPKVLSNKIVLTFAGLLANKVNIQGKNFSCIKCKKVLSEDTIQLRCGFSGKNALLAEFFIVRGINEITGKKLHPVIIHNAYLDEYETDVKKQGYTTRKNRVKLELNAEVTNG